MEKIGDKLGLSKKKMDDDDNFGYINKCKGPFNIKFTVPARVCGELRVIFYNEESQDACVEYDYCDLG